MAAPIATKASDFSEMDDAARRRKGKGHHW